MVIVKSITPSPPPSAPASEDRRSRRRLPVYLHESASVELTTHQGIVHGSIVDVCTGGLNVGLVDQRDWEKIQVGETVEVKISTRPGEATWPLSATIRHASVRVRYSMQYLSVGLSLKGSTSTLLARKRLSGFTSYRCPDLMRPIAFCSNPLFFCDTVHFQITEIRPNGLMALTSLRNKGLFPGERLDLTIMIPNAGEYATAVRIADIRADHPDQLYQTVELAFVDPDASMLAALGEFVLTFARDLNVETLRDQGFFLDTIFRAIRLGFVSDEHDWNAILELRLKAYHSVGKCLDKRTASDMRDPYDAFSRQIVARVGGSVVGAARVVFVGNDSTRSEHQGLGIVIPADILKAGVVEFSRFCSDPKFRGADVFIALMRQAGYVATRSSASHIVANCNSDLWDVYRKIGFYKVGRPFAAFGRDDCSLIVMDVKDTLLRGKSSQIAMWNQVVRPVQQEYARRTGHKSLHLWVALQRLVDPVISALRLRRRYRKFKSGQSGRKARSAA